MWARRDVLGSSFASRPVVNCVHIRRRHHQHRAFVPTRIAAISIVVAAICQARTSTCTFKVLRCEHRLTVNLVLSEKCFVKGVDIDLELSLEHTICRLFLVLEEWLLSTHMLLWYLLLQILQLWLHLLHSTTLALAFPGDDPPVWIRSIRWAHLTRHTSDLWRCCKGWVLIADLSLILAPIIRRIKDLRDRFHFEDFWASGLEPVILLTRYHDVLHQIMDAHGQIFYRGASHLALRRHLRKVSLALAVVFSHAEGLVDVSVPRYHCMTMLLLLRLLSVRGGYRITLELRGRRKVPHFHCATVLGVIYHLDFFADWHHKSTDLLRDLWLCILYFGQDFDLPKFSFRMMLVECSAKRAESIFILRTHPMLL